MNRFVSGSGKDTYKRKTTIFPEELVWECNQYPVRKLITVGDRIEVIVLYKIQDYGPLPSTL